MAWLFGGISRRFCEVDIRCSDVLASTSVHKMWPHFVQQCTILEMAGLMSVVKHATHAGEKKNVAHIEKRWEVNWIKAHRELRRWILNMGQTFQKATHQESIDYLKLIPLPEAETLNHRNFPNLYNMVLHAATMHGLLGKERQFVMTDMQGVGQAILKRLSALCMRQGAEVSEETLKIFREIGYLSDGTNLRELSKTDTEEEGPCKSRRCCGTTQQL
ncbi:hypothetical protein WH47_08414 [Habropoda laboriosa]|uniref:Uncharacterized protein n=1 Tax=Habropoda laboriosa TaxID=597456 RepID=A0A0L7RH38_9HYME|nr:hypothetical protein WH47_08414 [Habropoda laboriosa]